MGTSNSPYRALRISQVIEITGFSKSHLYRLLKDGQFPKPTKLSERVVIWSESAVNDWLASKFDGQIVGAAK